MKTLSKKTIVGMLAFSFLIGVILFSLVIDKTWEQEYYYKSGNLKKVVKYKGKQYHGTSVLYADESPARVIAKVSFNSGASINLKTIKK